jgi:hypothetical protein
MALDEKEVEAPQLLQGITLEDEQDEAGLSSKLKKKKQQE